jgi:hypothetical protein
MRALAESFCFIGVRRRSIRCDNVSRGWPGRGASRHRLCDSAAAEDPALPALIHLHKMTLFICATDRIVIGRIADELEPRDAYLEVRP